MYVVALFTKTESAKHCLCHSAIKLNSFPYLFYFYFIVKILEYYEKDSALLVLGKIQTKKSSSDAGWL